MATDFQFIGVDETLTAYESRGVDAWALFAGKRMIIRGHGIDELKKFLEMISRSGTVAVYTLKVYESVSDGGDIKSNTPDDGSFNFKIFALDGSSSRGQMSGIIGRHYGDPVQQEIMDRLEGIEEKINGAPEDAGIMSQITNALIGMLQEPRKLNEFLGALGAIGKPQSTAPGTFPGYLHSNTVTGVQRASRPAEITQPTPQPQATAPPALLTDESLQRIGNAVETIGKHDAKIVEHLEKLAAMATGNPSQFKTLLILLDSQ